MGKKRNLTKVSKRQAAQNKKQGLLEIWVDGSFFDQEGLAGGAAIICNHDGKITATQSFELNHLNIKISAMSELWAVAVTLDKAAPNTIGRLTTDCPAVQSIFGRIREGRPVKDEYPAALKTALENGLNKQPNMGLTKTTRGDRKIQLADKFAKGAARNDLHEIETVSRTSGNHPHTHWPSTPKTEI